MGKRQFCIIKKKQTYLAVEEVSYLRTSHCVHQALLRQFISFCHVFGQTEKKPENVVFYVLILLYHRVNNNYLLTYDSYVPLYNRFHRGEWITRVSGGEGALDTPGPLNGTSEAPTLVLHTLEMHVDFSFFYLRFAEAVSFDIKKLRRSCTPWMV
jgi:hypothetical protein